MRTVKTKLPEKLSDRILIALEDLEACEADPDYGIDMGDWHVPPIEGITETCDVCLAGGVMARRLKVPIDAYAEPYMFPRPIEEQLLELNQIRMGRVYDLDGEDIYSLGESDALAQMSRNPDDFHEWKTHMLAIVGRLQAEGR